MQSAVSADVRPPNYIIAGCNVCQSLLSSGMDRCHINIREGVGGVPLAAGLQRVERATPLAILPEQLNRLRRGLASIPEYLKLITSVGMLMDWPPWVALVHSLSGKDGGTEERHEMPMIQLQAMRLLCFSLVHSSYWSHARVVDMMSKGAVAIGGGGGTPSVVTGIIISNSTAAGMELLSPVTHDDATHSNNNMLLSLYCRQADVLTVRYGVLLHKLRSYYELDMTRLSAFHRVALLVGRLDLEEVGVLLSVPPIKWGRTIQRLVDNLWSHIGLLDSSSSSTTSSSSSSTTSSRLHLTNNNTSSRSSNDIGPISGADRLQSEARLLRDRFTQHLLDAQHETRFLKWVSSSLPSQGVSKDDDDDDAVGQSSPAPRKIHDGSGDGSDDLLDRAVGGSASAMGALEEAVLDLVDGHAFSLLEMEELSCMIDRELATDGLTEEIVDGLFLDDGSSSSCNDDDDARTADGKEDNVRACHFEEESSSSSILLARHCECCSSGNRSDHSSMMMYRRYLQQTLLSTDMSSVEEQLQQRHGHGKQLLHLRSLHKQTLQRTSAACAKYNPFDIVWKDHG